MTKKFHNQEFNYKKQEKTLDDVTLEVAKHLIEKGKLTDINPFRVMSRGNGRIIASFRSMGWYEQYRMELEHENKFGDTWIQFGEEKIISFSDDYDNYRIVFAEFKTEELLDHEEAEYIESMTRAYYDIKEDDGRYSVYDVYSQSELL